MNSPYPSNPDKSDAHAYIANAQRQPFRRKLRIPLILSLIVILFALPLAGCSGSTGRPAAETESTTQTVTGIETSEPASTTPAQTTAETTPETVPQAQPPSADAPVIALTFDDGPSLRDTGPLLDLLKEQAVPATFFVLGSQIDLGREDIVRRAWQEGHEIANHTYSHRQLNTLSAEEVREELEKTSQQIAAITGTQPTVMRPPNGAYNETVEEICRDLDLAIVIWDWISCPEDWNHHDNPDHIASHVVENARNGHIVLLHDTNEATIAAMPALIEGLKERGFRFMTVSELLAWQGEGHPQPGETYFSYTAE